VHPTGKEIAVMVGRLVLIVSVVAGIGFVPLSAMAEPITFKMLSNYSRATFKADAPLETIVGTTSGPGVTGNLTVDPAKPDAAAGTIKVDLSTLSSGVTKRDEDMKGTQYLDTAASDANRYAVFEVKNVELAGPLEPGKEAAAKVTGILTIKGKPVQKVADARVTYIKLTTDQLEKDNQKRFGFTTDNLKVRAKFATTLTDHGIPIPQLLILKLSNDIQLETDLTFAKQ
jgi:polyisoprenoid-binding protein YceI